jgi:hypothetical protein
LQIKKLLKWRAANLARWPDPGRANEWQTSSWASCAFIRLRSALFTRAQPSYGWYHTGTPWRCASQLHFVLQRHPSRRACDRVVGWITELTAHLSSHQVPNSRYTEIWKEWRNPNCHAGSGRCFISNVGLPVLHIQFCLSLRGAAHRVELDSSGRVQCGDQCWIQSTLAMERSVKPFSWATFSCPGAAPLISLPRCWFAPECTKSASE